MRVHASMCVHLCLCVPTYVCVDMGCVCTDDWVTLMPVGFMFYVCAHV